MSGDFQFRVLTSEDWKDSVDITFEFTDGLRLKNDNKDGTFISRPLDSGIPGCRWHRIVLDAIIPENSTVSVSFSTSDTEETTGDWSNTIVFYNTKDALIPQDVKPGQYISLKIDFHREEEADTPVVKQVKVYYERISYLRYLPALYQENNQGREFLERFLSIFESSFYDKDEAISHLPSYFDPESAPEEFYRWLAGWLSLDLYDLLGKKNREFILKATGLYRQKGTVPGIASLVTFLTGSSKTCIKEYRNNVFRSYGMEHEPYEREPGNIEDIILQCKENSEEGMCTKFYRRTSKTLDTNNEVLLKSMGTYCDQVHYVNDSGKEGRYSTHVIGIFIFLPQGEEQFFIDKEQLLKIINSFLPVFVRAEINIIGVSYKEEYPVNMIIDTYRDVFKKAGKVVKTSGWKSNRIAGDCSRLLAALLKKDFTEMVGIQYMAVGGGYGKEQKFKQQVIELFKKWDGTFPPPSDTKKWVWAKPISDIIYIDDAGNPQDDVTNRLKITIEFGVNEPTEDTWTFEEFALLGIDRNDAKFDPDKLFFINYVKHGQFVKDMDMTFTRTVQLIFPYEKGDIRI